MNILKWFKSRKNMIKINGKTYVGNNVTISGNRVIIDGKDVSCEDQLKIDIKIDAPLQSLNVDYANEIIINGDVGDANSKNGNLVISGNVSGNAETKNGNIVCGNVGGNVQTKNGNIKHT